MKVHIAYYIHFNLYSYLTSQNFLIITRLKFIIGIINILKDIKNIKPDNVIPIYHRSVHISNKQIHINSGIL